MVMAKLPNDVSLDGLAPRRSDGAQREIPLKRSWGKLPYAVLQSSLDAAHDFNRRDMRPRAQKELATIARCQAVLDNADAVRLRG
jgi:hypothetical protein